MVRKLAAAGQVEHEPCRLTGKPATAGKTGLLRRVARARRARPLLGPMAVRNRIGGDRGPAGRKESSHGWAATCRIPSRNQAIRGVERANRSISRALCQPLSQLPKHGCTRPCRFRLRRCPVVANGSDENRDVPFEKPADRCHLEQKSNLKHSDVEVLRMQVGKNLTL